MYGVDSIYHGCMVWIVSKMGVSVKLTRAAGHTYSRKILLTSSLSPDSDCNSTSSASIYFSHIIYLQFRQYCLFYCKDARTLKNFILIIKTS